MRFTCASPIQHERHFTIVRSAAAVVLRVGKQIIITPSLTATTSPTENAADSRAVRRHIPTTTTTGDACFSVDATTQSEILNATDRARTTPQSDARLQCMVVIVAATPPELRQRKRWSRLPSGQRNQLLGEFHDGAQKF